MKSYPCPRKGAVLASGKRYRTTEPTGETAPYPQGTSWPWAAKPLTASQSVWQQSCRRLGCHTGNYRKGRTEPVKYLVVHYVGATGGAKANAEYYGRTPNVGASAHYFVGHAAEGGEIWSSVPEEDTAWHVGAKRYFHPECRNANSIGVEICCHKRPDGTWYFDPETVEAAVALCRDIVRRYGLDKEHVLRHYDVTHKKCPAPFVEDEGAWVKFRTRVCEEEEMKVYRYVAELPDWAREAATKAIQKGVIKLDSAGCMTVWEPNVQVIVWMDRVGLL